MNIKGFIFDLDGTLLDSMDAWDNIGVNYLVSKGVTDIPENLKKLLKTMSLLQGCEYFVEKFGLDLQPQQILNEIYSMIEDAYEYDVQPKKGVIEFLEKHKDIKMCVATESFKYLAEAALTRLDMMKYFDFIITSNELGGSKRDNRIYLEAVKMLETGIDETVVFEDTPHSIRSAKSAGFYTVGVSEKVFENEREEIIKSADYFVEDLNDFEVIL